MFSLYLVIRTDEAKIGIGIFCQSLIYFFLPILNILVCEERFFFSSSSSELSSAQESQGKSNLELLLLLNIRFDITTDLNSYCWKWQRAEKKSKDKVRKEIQD